MLLVGVNLWVVAQWMGLEYTAARESIEWSYLGLARYFAEHGFATVYGDAEWFPYWYGGVPFENTYPPLLHVVVAAFSGMGVGRAYHVVTAAFYCLGPIGVWLLGWRWTGKLWPSLCGAVFYGLLAPCSWLMPSIAGDLQGYHLNQRLSVLARYGEGPHVASLALLPFAMLALDWALERMSWRRAAIAALACALVVLSNVIGGFALAWGALGIVVSRRKFLPAIGIGVWAYLLALRWLQPETIADIRRNAPSVGGSFVMDGLHTGALLGLALVAVCAVWWWRGDSQLGKLLGFLLPMSAIPLSWEYAQFYFAPQPHRYHLEMDLGLALLLAFGLAKLPKANWFAGVGVAALVGFGLWQGRGLDKWIQPFRYEESWERRVTRWMGNYDPEARVYVQGTPRFFTGVELDQVQFGGGFLNGVRLPVFLLADYGITATKGDGPLTVAWLKAMGVDFVQVGEKDSEDPFRNWQDSKQFSGLLEEVWRERGDVIYAVGRENQSLAHVMDAGAVMRKRPQSYEERDELMRYVGAMQSGLLEWQSASQARIEAELRGGDGISVQVAYDKRWKARVDGKVWPIEEDGLGWMWIPARQSGKVVVELVYQTPRVVLVVCGCAWLVLLGALFEFRMAGARERYKT